jgi:hypothetical protein
MDSNDTNYFSKRMLLRMSLVYAGLSGAYL